MKGRKLDSLGIAGIIVNFVFLGLETLASIILFIAGIIMLAQSTAGLLMIFFAVVIGSLTIVTTLFNAKVLSGELRFKLVASVLGFVCLSILGSILLIVSKDEVKSEHEDDLAKTLIQFKQLLDAGAITEEEFGVLKRNLIK